MKFMEESCIDSVPDVLIDYLWQLIAEDDAFNQIFVLKPRYLGDRAVQDIHVFAAKGSFERTVFGCEPVDAVLEVRKRGDDMIMSLSEDKITEGRNHWKERVICTA